MARLLTGFPKTSWPRRRFSASYAARISVKVSQISEFRAIMGIKTGLLGCCSSSTLGSRANDNVWLHHSPCSSGAGWTTSSQPGHDPLNQTHIFILPNSPGFYFLGGTHLDRTTLWVNSWYIFGPQRSVWSQLLILAPLKDIFYHLDMPVIGRHSHNRQTGMW